MGGGGLFKSVQAPQVPGSQTWALMLVHPDGLVTATKRVRVVSSLRPPWLLRSSDVALRHRHRQIPAGLDRTPALSPGL